MTKKLLPALVLALAFNTAAEPQRGVGVKKARPALTKPAASYNPQQAALVVDGSTGAILFEQDADVLVYPASLTKMMTLYITFEALEKGTIRLDQKLPVSAYAAKFTSLHLKKGMTITTEESILALTTKSANDASIVLAETLRGNTKNFVGMMNATALKLGMLRTHFENPNGLPDPGLKQVTTARDMITLAKAHLRDFPQYQKYFQAKDFVFRGVTYTNHNTLMNDVPEIDFGKTGFINASGFNLAVSAKRENTRVFAVVFGGVTADSRNKRMEKILNESFDKALQKKAPEKEATLPVAEVVSLIPEANSVGLPAAPQPSGP